MRMYATAYWWRHGTSLKLQFWIRSRQKQSLRTTGTRSPKEKRNHLLTMLTGCDLLLKNNQTLAVSTRLFSRMLWWAYWCSLVCRVYILLQYRGQSKNNSLKLAKYTVYFVYRMELAVLGKRPEIHSGFQIVFLYSRQWIYTRNLELYLYKNTMLKEMQQKIHTCQCSSLLCVWNFACKNNKFCALCRKKTS